MTDLHELISDGCYHHYLAVESDNTLPQFSIASSNETAMTDQHELINNECYYCPPVESVGPLVRPYFERLFHQPCSSCPVAKPDPDPLLCDQCQHLRVWHLLRCVDHELRPERLLPLPMILLEEAGEIRCSFCRIIKATLTSAFDLFQLLDIQTQFPVLYLNLDPHGGQPRASEGIHLADISVDMETTEGASGGILGVGDLQIRDLKQGIDLPQVEGFVSWRRLKLALDECEEHHVLCRRDNGAVLPKNFRVIDVRRRCVVETRNDPFVALSYVWGSANYPSFLTATRDTIQAMMKHGGLPERHVPRTIEDAMLVCEQLGEQFLWVDRLCILQDDEEDKKRQIDTMGGIYSAANFVIIAAYGDNMDYGLSGVRVAREKFQHSVDIYGYRFTNILRERQNDPLAVWYTRGWTYQEGALARRRLYFTNSRAYLECGSSTFHEDRYNQEVGLKKHLSDGLYLPSDKSRFQAFSRHLRMYTSRMLSYRSDANNAFKGISNALYGHRGNFIQGLPLVQFDQAMLWWSLDGRSSLSPGEGTLQVTPTWTWLSRMCRGDAMKYHSRKFYGALAFWYDISDCSSGFVQRKPINLIPETEVDDDWALIMANAVSEGCTSIDPLSLRRHDQDSRTFQDTFNRYWVTYNAFCVQAAQCAEQCISEQVEKPFELDQSDNMDMKFINRVLIITLTQSALLRLDSDDKMPSRYSGPGIFNEAAEKIGGLCGHCESLVRELRSGRDHKSTKHEFIALSLSGHTGRWLMESEELQVRRYHNNKGDKLRHIPIVNVLLIGWRGQYAYRRELGWIFLKDWAEARREWRRIPLI
ncbi:HET-domain-containing protein [Mytilinidion resinicola]|uniref:HET-domain-containing protein n=1 Tax=Mytilinidion resinicola TaxID=574789 RepID=A0A6A6YVJ3_9PEZI|nr:HET-domain-containing protein [Mytilinidion resinicola]KAF2812976.1 HET-domain-containing protein [Mytilinidion resinicola]